MRFERSLPRQRPPGPSRPTGRLLPAAAAALSATLATASLPALTITEIMYHPAAADELAAGGRNLEWIELHNESPSVVNLSGYSFSAGVTFTFPHDTYLEGGAYLVICADEEAVRQHYGITNTTGNFTGRLDNNGETIRLDIFGGGPVVEVDYSDRGQWPQAADGTGHSLVLKDPFLDPSDSDHWTWSNLRGGTPGGPNFDEPTTTEAVLLPAGSTWRYNDSGEDLGTSWREPGFDDSGWPAGPAELGYGDGDEATVLDFGGDPNNKRITYYFRTTFEVPDPSRFDEISLRLVRDDGAVVHLGGSEVARTNLPEGPVAAGTRALTAMGGGDESAFNAFTVAASRLQRGTNLVAVEIHQAGPTSSDISFNLEIAGVKVLIPTPTGDPVPVVINEVFSRTAGDPWIELCNPSQEPFDLSGFFLSNDRNNLGLWPLPPESLVPAHGFLTLSASVTGLELRGEEVAFYLTRPDLSEVVAAEVFASPPLQEPPLDGTSDARFPDGSGRFFRSTTPTWNGPNAVALQENIVINEIMYHPPRGRESLEFLELTNRGADAVDLGGYRFTRGISYTFPPGTQLAPGAFLVVARDPGAIEAGHGISGVLGPYEGELSDGGELVRLVDPLGNIADQVRYHDSGRWSRWADGGGSSLELVDPRQDNAVASAWEASDESAKSRWEVIEYSVSYTQESESELQIRMMGRAEVLIDDIRVTRGTTEYVPNGSFESSTSGWILAGNHGQSHRTTEDSYDGTACLKIVATGDGDTRVNRIERDTSPFMTSGTYTVHVAARWLRGTQLLYLSGYRQGASFQHTHWLAYPENLGTPGARNSRAADNAGPVISAVEHSPAVPAGGETVTVRARLSDADGVGSALLLWRPGSPAGAFSSAPLFDDGAHGDGEAGDGVYAGTIPGQSSGTRVVYYVEGEDGFGARRRFPVEAPQRTLVYLHDSPLTARRAYTYRLILDDAAWNELNTRPLHSNELLDATFVFNESRVYYNAGTRFRGSPWQRPASPRMYRVAFGRDEPFRGLRAINLSRYGSGQNERAAHYSVWRNSTATTPCPKSESEWARVRTNGGTYTMEHIQPVNRDYLKVWFPGDADGIALKVLAKQVFDDSGTNFQVEWARYANQGTNKATYRWNFSHRTREEDDDYTPFIALIQTMNASNTVLETQLESIMDVEQWLRVYAARCAHDDWDTISIGNGQNAYVYYAPGEGRWNLLAWDMDNSWANTGARIYPDGDATFARIVALPRYRRLYQGILNEMVNGRNGRPGHWSAEEMVAKFLDRNTTAVGADGVAGAGGIRNFINGRRGALAGQVPAPVPFEITTQDGLTVNATRATIEGTGWVNVSVIVAGETPLEVAWTATTRWRAEVEVEGGANDLTFLAFDADGNLVGSDSIQVTSTVGWRVPSIASVDPSSARPGERITVAGSEFHEGVAVFFSGVESPEVEFDEDVDPTRLAAEVPFLPPGPSAVIVVNVDSRRSDPASFTVLPPPPVFVRGDANLDTAVDLADAVATLAHLFRGAALSCEDALDADDDEAVTLTDAVRVLEFLFRAGAPPPAPYPARGQDPGAGLPLGCDEGLDPFRL